MAEFDQDKAQTFAGKMMDALNGGMLGLMLGIGHRTDLFDVLTALEPSTSQQIADAAGLNERYVREWLDTMVVSRVVDYIPESERYHLPAEHAAALNSQAVQITSRALPVRWDTWAGLRRMWPSAFAKVAAFPMPPFRII